MLNYILIINNLPLVIIYNEDKKYYYAALEKFDEEEDLNPMIEFIKYEMEKAWENTLDNASNVKKITSKLENYLD